MRWKLLILASTLATLAGAGASLGIAYGLLGNVEPGSTPNAAVLAVLVVPLGVIAAASIFVYRHTARLRPLQAALTAIISATLTLALFVAGALLLLPEQTPERQAPPPVTNVD